VLEEGGHEDSIEGREGSLMDLAADEHEQQKSKLFDHNGSQDFEEPNSNLFRIDIGNQVASENLRAPCKSTPESKVTTSRTRCLSVDWILWSCTRADDITTKVDPPQRETGITEGLSYRQSHLLNIRKPMILPQRTTRPSEKPVLRKAHLTGEAILSTC
jgi:hypothetical protein